MPGVAIRPVIGVPLVPVVLAWCEDNEKPLVAGFVRLARENRRSRRSTGMSWLSYNGTDSTYSEQGLLFLLYRQHFGTIPIEISGNSPQSAPKWPAGGDQSSVTSGSPTYPFDMSAALSGDGRTLTIAAINATADAHSVDLTLAGFTLRSRGQLWRLTGPSLDSSNQVGQPPQVTVTETDFDTGEARLPVEPYSTELRAYTKH